MPEMISLMHEVWNSLFYFVWGALYKVHAAILGSSVKLFVLAMILILLTGLAGGLAAKKLKQPLILGYILAGVLAGTLIKSAVGSAGAMALDSLADMGVALLLFSMGLEFSKADLKPVYKVSVWGSLAQVFFTLISGAALAWGISRYRPELFTGPASWLLFGCAFVSTSTAVVLKTLKSRRRTGTLSYRVMIGISIVQDLTVIPLMLLICRLDDLSSGFLKAFFPICTGTVFMVLMLTAGSKYIPMWLRHIARFESKELFLLAVTVLALGIGLVADMAGTSFSFGAFIAGIVLSDSDYGKKALYELMPVRDIFAMLFFVSIGMMLDVSFLIRNAALVIILTAATGMTRTIFLSAVTAKAGYRNVIPIAMFFGMFPTSEMAFVVIQTGKNTGLFPAALYSLILCVVVCSMITGPMLDSLTSPVYSLFRKTIWKKAPSSDIVMPPPALMGHVIIAGGGAIARFMAKLFTNLKFPYLIIETEHPAFQEAKKASLLCIYGDPRQDVILSTAGISEAGILLLASPGLENNLAIIRRARALNPDIKIVARAESEREVEELHRQNIHEIVQPRFEAGLELTRQALLSMNVPPIEIQNFLDSIRFDRYKPLMEGSEGFSAIERMRSFAGLTALNWIRIPADSVFAGKTLKETAVRSQYGVSIVGILHEGRFTSNPGPGCVMNPGDILAVMGTAEDQKLFGEAAGAGPSSTPAEARRDQTEAENLETKKTE